MLFISADHKQSGQSQANKSPITLDFLLPGRRYDGMKSETWWTAFPQGQLATKTEVLCEQPPGEQIPNR